MKKPKISPRKPPAPSKAEDAAAFIRGAAGPGEDAKNQRVTVYIQPGLWVRAQHMAVDRRQSLSALVADALELMLAK